MGSDQIFNRARAKHEAKKFGEAIQLYQMVLIKEPRHLDANYLLGTVYAEIGKHEEALKYLLRAENLMPNSPFIKINIGNIFMLQGDYEPALIYYIDALKLQDDLQEARHNLGVVIEKMDQKSEKAAASCLEYGILCIQAGRNDEALSIMIAGNSMDPTNTYIRYLKTILEGNQPDKELQDEFDSLEVENDTEYQADNEASLFLNKTE